MSETTAAPQSNILDRPLASLLALDWYTVAWIVIIVLAVVTRFYDLGARVMSHDESLHTYYSWRLAQGSGFQHTPMMHGTFQFHTLALSYTLFGDNDFTSRIPSALFGIAAVAMVWLFRPWLGKAGALLAGIFMLISPYILYYSRYVRNEAFVMPLVLLMAYAMFRYFEGREARWLYVIAASMALHFTVKETAFIYLAIWMLFLGFLYIRDMWHADWYDPMFHEIFKVGMIVALVIVVAIAGVEVFGERFSESLNPESTAVPIDPTTTLEDAEAVADDPIGEIVKWLGLSLVVVVTIGGGLSLYDLREKLLQYASVDLLLMMLTLVLPMLTAFPVVEIFNRDPLNYNLPFPNVFDALSAGQTTIGEIFQTDAVITLTTFIVLSLVGAAIGLTWNWQKWLIAAGVFYGIFVPFYTTIFTNGGGFWTGAIGSLGYWLEQQDVRRGNQPWYYYIFVQLPIYEYLPTIGAFVAAWMGLDWLVMRFIGQADATAEAIKAGQKPDDKPTSPPASPVERFPALAFIGLWSVFAVVAFSVAGEKMPWLTVHLTLPMILLAGWAFGRWFDKADWAQIRTTPGALGAMLVPTTIVVLVAIILQLVDPTSRPFQGNELLQLQQTTAFMLAFAAGAGSLAGLYYVGRQIGWAALGGLVKVMFVGLLAVLTARAAIYAVYINYDYQTEFINYASGAPGIRTVMDQVEEISIRLTDGTRVKVAYDDDVSWPMTWYMRDYTEQVYYGQSPTRSLFEDVPLVIAGDNNWNRVEPILGDRYYSFEYIRMWWPMQEYFGLSGERIKNALTTERGYIGAIWDIWFYRDYQAYGELNGVDYSLTQWPVVDRMRFYIRKDIAAQIWELGVGPTLQDDPTLAEEYNNHHDVFAQTVWGEFGTGFGAFNSPRGIAVAPDGNIFVADTYNHVIQKFNADGLFLLQWGRHGRIDDGTGDPGTFWEPWGIAVGPDGNVYVADTWNHRIQKFSPTGEFLTTWGQFGTELENLNLMWGPRDIAVGPDGNVYVTDTGNKRILVYTSEGIPIRSVGVSGVLAGELDEPVGIAIDPNGRLYVADAWNRRVQVFNTDGLYEYEWPVSAWFGQSLHNKPYITINAEGQVFISDPEGYRIIAFDSVGNYLYSFGDLGTTDNLFALPVGLDVDAEGRLLVADADNHRIMRFDLSDIPILPPGNELLPDQPPAEEPEGEEVLPTDEEAVEEILPTDEEVVEEEVLPTEDAPLPTDEGDAPTGVDQ